MHRMGRKQAGIFVAVFAAAMVYAATCSSQCLVEHCVPAPAGNAGHEHGQHGNSGESRQAPDTACQSHGHPGSFLRAPKSVQPNLAKAGCAWGPVETSAAGFAGVAQLVLEAREHAPPSEPQPVFEKTSSLRI